jgi:hypothetical protein
MRRHIAGALQREDGIYIFGSCRADIHFGPLKYISASERRT